MRLWRHMIQNWIGDIPLIIGIGCTAIGIVLLLSQIIIDVTHNH